MNNLDLTKLPDSDLILGVKKDGCSDCFLEITRRYEKIYFNLCHRYYPIFEKKGLNITDFLEEKNILIYDCIKSYNPKRKTKLSSHIYNYGRFLILNSLNSKKTLFSATDNDELKQHIENTQIKNEYFNSSIKEEDKKFLHDILNKIKDKRIRKVITLRHFTDKKQRKWKNIAVRMGLSIQSCLILYKKGLKILNGKFKEKRKCMNEQFEKWWMNEGRFIDSKNKEYARQVWISGQLSYYNFTPILTNGERKLIPDNRTPDQKWRDSHVFDIT